MLLFFLAYDRPLAKRRSDYLSINVFKLKQYIIYLFQKSNTRMLTMSAKLQTNLSIYLIKHDFFALRAIKYCKIKLNLQMLTFNFMEIANKQYFKT